MVADVAGEVNAQPLPWQVPGKHRHIPSVVVEHDLLSAFSTAYGTLDPDNDIVCCFAQSFKADDVSLLSQVRLAI